MIPDIKINDYYLQFIHNAYKDIKEYTKNLELIINTKEKVIKYLKNNIEVINDKFNINFLYYNNTEWNSKDYNSKETIYHTALKLIKTNIEESDRIILLQIIKYCNLIRSEHRFNKLIELAKKRKDIKYSIYRKYISNYYCQVHKVVLQGMGYKFSHDIGTYVINHWKLDPNKRKNKYHIDYAATNAKKKELLAKGVKLYDEKEAAWYKARHIPYKAADYRVFKENTDWYEFTFIKSNIVKNSCLEYKHTEYINLKYRGMSYLYLAENVCKNEEDVYNLQVDIKYKLNILLAKNPNLYLNFIRNAEQCKYKRGAHNS